MNANALVSRETYLAHHGVKGQKWGVRRFQNADGTLNAKGQRRLTKDLRSLDRRQKKALKRSSSPYYMSAFPGLASHSLRRANRKYNRMVKKYGKMKLDVLSEQQIKNGEIIADRTFVATQRAIAQRRTQMAARRAAKRYGR